MLPRVLQRRLKAAFEQLYAIVSSFDQSYSLELVYVEKMLLYMFEKLFEIVSEQLYSAFSNCGQVYRLKLIA